MRTREDGALALGPDSRAGGVEVGALEMAEDRIAQLANALAGSRDCLHSMKCG